MGIAERREREKEQRMNQILDAAQTVFFAKGADLATMDDVAEEAELSKGTLYLYFKSKEELYFGIVKRGLEILEKMFKQAVENEKTGLKKVSAIGKAYYQYCKEYPKYFKSMIYFESKELDFENKHSIAADVDLKGHSVIKIIAEAIQTGIEDGSIRPDLDPIKTAIILWGQSYGVIQLLFMKGNHIKHQHNMDLEAIFNYSFNAHKYFLENKKRD